MKRVLILFLLAALFLWGCAPAQSVVTVDASYQGKNITFTVDTENRTIYDGQHTYSYQIRGNSTYISYPNGASYYETRNDSIANIGWSDNYDANSYMDGDMLITVLGQATPEKRGGNAFVNLFLIGLGAFYAFAPHAAWYLSYGWHYKDAEPSNASLAVARISGVIMMVLGLGLAIL